MQVADAYCTQRQQLQHTSTTHAVYTAIAAYTAHTAPPGWSVEFFCCWSEQVSNSWSSTHDSKLKHAQHLYTKHPSCQTPAPSLTVFAVTAFTTAATKITAPTTTATKTELKATTLKQP